MATSTAPASSTARMSSAARSEGMQSDNTAPSSLAPSVSFREEQHTPRGRSETKPTINQELVCVVAFLITEQNIEDTSDIRRIQDIRKQFDQAHRRWLPHITLIPPFMVPFANESLSQGSKEGPLNTQSMSPKDAQTSSLESIHKDLEDICIKIQVICNHSVQHRMSLGEIGHFPLRRYRTVHLRPLHGTDDSFHEVQKNLEKALPQAKESSRGNQHKKKQGDVYKPHLTLGQSYSQDMHKCLNKLADSLLVDGPIRVTVDKIQLMTKPSHQSGPYDVYREFPLQIVKST